MAGGKGSHVARRFLQRLRMKRALGIQGRHPMRSTSRFRGRDRRRGTWWDRVQNCIAIEGLDFARDTQEGGADRFELILDSDEDEGVKGSHVVCGDDEFVPETEPQECIAVSNITGPCANQGRRLGTMLHEWRQIIMEQEQECSCQFQSKEVEDLKACSKEEKNQKDSAKEGMQQNTHAKEEPADHKTSFSDLSTDDEASWVEDGVDLRGHSQVDDDNFN